MTETGVAPAALWAPAAWVGGRWRERVLLTIDAGGCWHDVVPDTEPPPHATRLAAPALPGLVDAHSHAFQRAFAGCGESRTADRDDFWSWRDRMYGVALRITPAQLRAVAAHLYAELLAGGYTHVCEFHYLQHDREGRPYARAAELAWALADAAADAGIGLTLLPVLYERAGFAQSALRDDQRRFRLDAAGALALQRELNGARVPLLDAGVAVHSLRAAAPSSIAALAAAAAGDRPIHIHVAEQTAEVDDCLAATGKRPIEWLASNVSLDARWQLVHATHATPQEIDAVAARGAGIVLCPGTEANLGDGVPDLPRWLASGAPLSIGSDSQVTRAWPEELRWLEYTQRLVRRQRNVAADPPREPDTAARLYERARAGGGTAAGHTRWGFERGARADLLVVDGTDPALVGLAQRRLLDGIVFAGAARPFAATLVAGRWRAPDRARLAAAYAAAIAELDVAK